MERSRNPEENHRLPNWADFELNKQIGTLLKTSTKLIVLDRRDAASEHTKVILGAMSDRAKEYASLERKDLETSKKKGRREKEAEEKKTIPGNSKVLKVEEERTEAEGVAVVLDVVEEDE